MCTVKISAVVGVDTNGDGMRDQIIIVGTVEDCSGLRVAILGNAVPPAGAQIADGVSSAATILAQGASAHGVSPAGNERVFTVTFTLFDTTNFKGDCGTVPLAGGLGLLAVCDDDSQCRDAVFWDEPIDCVRVTTPCPVVSVSVDPSDSCEGETRSVVCPSWRILSPPGSPPM